jgi:hypothetical protein
VTRASAGELSGELAEQVVVDSAGDDRHDGGVAFVTGHRGRAGQHRAVRVAVIRTRRSPGAGVVWLRAVGAHPAEQVVEAHVDLDLRRLACPIRYATGGDQPSAGLIGICIVIWLDDQAGQPVQFTSVSVTVWWASLIMYVTSAKPPNSARRTYTVEEIQRLL